jgi:hypothetical protein
MNGIVLKTDSKWQDHPFYDAQVGTVGMCLVEVDPDRNYYVNQPVQFAILGNVPGETNGTTPWQDGVVSNISEGWVSIFAGTGTF